MLRKETCFSQQGNRERWGKEASPGSTACIRSGQGPDSSCYCHFQRPWGFPVLTPQPSSPAVSDSFQPCAHQHQGVRVWIFQVILLIQPYKTFPTSLPPPLSSKKQWHEREGLTRHRPPPHPWPGAILQNAGRVRGGGRPQKHQQIKRGANRTRNTTQS